MQKVARNAGVRHRHYLPLSCHTHTECEGTLRGWRGLLRAPCANPLSCHAHTECAATFPYGRGYCLSLPCGNLAPQGRLPHLPCSNPAPEGTLLDAPCSNPDCWTERRGGSSNVHGSAGCGGPGAPGEAPERARSAAPGAQRPGARQLLAAGVRLGLRGVASRDMDRQFLFASVAYTTCSAVAQNLVPAGNSRAAGSEVAVQGAAGDMI